jgi:hypothetical protein
MIKDRLRQGMNFSEINGPVPRRISESFRFVSYGIRWSDVAETLSGYIYIIDPGVFIVETREKHFVQLGGHIGRRFEVRREMRRPYAVPENRRTGRRGTNAGAQIAPW